MTEEKKEKSLVELISERTFNNEGIQHTIVVIAVVAGFVFSTMIMGTAFLITSLKIAGMI